LDLDTNVVIKTQINYLLSTLIASLCLLTGLYAESTVYVWLIAASGLAGFITWVGIAACHYRFRKAYIA